MSKGKDNAKIVIFVVAAIVSLAVFGYMQLTTTTVYIATDTIMSNTQITQEMLGSGLIKPVSVSKSLTNDASIKNFSDIEGQFLKFPLGPDKMIFSYDFAGESDMRNNKILRDQNLEALPLHADSVVNSVGNISVNDKINLYSVEELDLSVFAESGMILISSLPADIQKIFIEAGKLTPESSIGVGTYKYSKLIAQNIPVVEVTKDTETGQVSEFVLGVTPSISENIYLAMDSGKLSINILPYSEKEYKIKDSSGSLQNLQVISKDENNIKTNNN